MSISLPGMGGAGSAGGSAWTRPSALTRMMGIPELELSAKERVMAMWRISSKSISVPMACTGVADECHAKLAISDTDHHTHVPERQARLADGDAEPGLQRSGGVQFQKAGKEWYERVSGCSHHWIYCNWKTTSAHRCAKLEGYTSSTPAMLGVRSSSR